MTDYTDRVCPRCHDANLKADQEVCERCASRNGKRGRRSSDEAQHVLVDSFLNGASKKINRIEKIAGSALLAMILAFGGLMWRGGTWTRSIEDGFKIVATRDSAILATVEHVGDELAQHVTADDARVAALAAAVAEIDKTMAVIVANQTNLRAMIELGRRMDQQEE